MHIVDIIQYPYLSTMFYHKSTATSWSYFTTYKSVNAIASGGIAIE